MAKLAQAQEPSMEEILASIRRIITDEEAANQGQVPVLAPAAPKGANAPPPPSLASAALEAAPAATHTAPQVSAAPQVDTAELDQIFAGEPQAAADVLELSEAQVVAPPAATGMADLPEDIDFVEERPAPPRPAVREQAREVAPSPDTSLLSAGADAAVTAAFNSLAGTILASQAVTLEDLVKDVLRPLLKSWLDVNLPPLVERLVREEIERVARARR